MNDAPDWHRLGAAVKARREQLRLSRHALQAAGAPSVDTIRKIELGNVKTLKNSTKWDLEQALGWERGSVDAITAGGEPTITGTATGSASPVAVIESPGERILIQIVNGASELTEKDRQEVLAIIRLKLDRAS